MDTALQHLIDHIQTAAAQRTPLRIRGGGSGLDVINEVLQGGVHGCSRVKQWPRC